MCVEGRLKQEKIQGCWFVDGKVPSISASEVGNLFSEKFFKQCDRVGKTKKNYTPCNLVLKPLLELLKSNQM